MQSRLPQSHKIRWNRLVILIAGVLGVLLLLCAGVAALAPNLRRIIQAPMWKTDAQLAAQAAHSMLDYDLPPDYQESRVLKVQKESPVVPLRFPSGTVLRGRCAAGTVVYHLMRADFYE